jgi:hypothetical protein
MSGKNLARFAVVIFASWVVMWLGRNRLPEPLTQGLAFWVMFLILPLTFSDKDAEKNPALVRNILAATAGGTVVPILNMLMGGWQGK